MKKLILLILFVQVTSCVTETGNERHYHYEIVNNSGVNIEIIPYKNPDNSQADVSKKISILNGKSYSKEVSVSPPYADNLDFQRMLYEGYLTKVCFTFNNSKKILYEYCPNGICLNDRNIFNYTFNNETTEIYTITPEDYQNAIDCGGNCN
ncbi:hypothetical protein [Flavobacterium restrictum]|uniref:Uncharacterized protein n=1 Tax=Flavobacterium restrictum TaxID=2594428 RepID=A0A553EBA9_9FLAO|nr:hypothetical protein [Flavobacterium restrictum]TRX42235.1 hypothetical protein FNW21_02955 [Flavobacterium restrictum]